jgi:hypothetical protein
MRARASEEEAGRIPETRRWLEAIRRQLTAKMPLATRLVVTAPRYIEFSIQVTIEASAGSDPQIVRAAKASCAKDLLSWGRRPVVPVSRSPSAISAG